MGIILQGGAKQGCHTSLLQRLPKTERSDKTGVIPDSGRGRMYRLAGRHDDIIDLDANSVY